MKKLVVFLVSFCLLIGFTVPFASAAEVTPSIEPEVYPEVSSEVVQPVADVNVSSLLMEKNIEFKIIDGNIVLNDPSKVAEANNALATVSPQIGPDSVTAASTSYPTAYVYMKNYDRVNSKKFTVASRAAFAAAFAAWAKNITSSWNEIAGVAVAAYGTYYFVNTGTENIYTFTKYYYRELGPGHFDSNGNYYGNYEIKKTHRTTKSSGGTGGQLSTFTKKSTIIEPWF